MTHPIDKLKEALATTGVVHKPWRTSYQELREAVEEVIESLASELAETAEGAEAFSMRISDCCDLIPSGHVWNVQRGRALIEQRDARLARQLSRDGVMLVKHGTDCAFEKRVRGAVDVLSIEDRSVPRTDFERGERAGFAQCLVAIGNAMKEPLPDPPPKADEGKRT